MRAVKRPHPRLPGTLQPLQALARNLRWTWRPSLRVLFETIDPAVWSETGGNPVEVLRRAPWESLEELARDAGFLARLSAIVSEIATEEDAPSRSPAARALVARGDRIAYFSAEFGLTELLPVYAGGLGVLAGDHLKSASDLAIPLVGVGLFYREGYFRQSLDPLEGQREENPVLDVEGLPIAYPETLARRTPAGRGRGGGRPFDLRSHPHRRGRPDPAAPARHAHSRERARGSGDHRSPLWRRPRDADPPGDRARRRRSPRSRTAGLSA